MMESVHGHEVMHMMANSGLSYNRQSLLSAIHENFGIETRFHTCSAENMDADALIDFLEARGKFVDMGDGFSTPREKICSHG